MRILIIKYKNIGDVLLSIPVVENLKYHYPDTQIDYALNDYCIDMISNHPKIEKIFPYRRNYYKSLNIFQRFYEELKYFKNIISRRYDIVINLTKGERGVLLALFSGAKIKLGYKPEGSIFKYLNPFTQNIDNTIKHTVEKDLDFIKLLGKEIVSKNVTLFYSQEDQKKIDAFFNDKKIKKFVHIHPVSRWMFKCWDINKMAQVIDYIDAKGYQTILTASNDPIEMEMIEDIISKCKSQPYNLSGELTLKELAYLSSKSDLFFGIDSAPMHMAASLDKPIVALMGASRADIWGPWENSVPCSYSQSTKIQKVGKNSIITSNNYEHFFDQGIKKCKGMVEIDYSEVKALLDEKI